MSFVQVQGNASGTGTLTIAAPNTNSNYTLTLPTGTGTFTVNGINSNIVSGTAVASTSGTSIDFTGIPSWVKRVTVMLAGVSTSGTSNLQIQVGGGSVQTSGYLGSCGYISGTPASALFTAGFGIANTVGAGSIEHGALTLSLLDSATNTWIASGTFALSDGAVAFATAGRKVVTTALDRVRITTVNGTDTFDAGSINILYE
jgi:hypothetical protein